MKAAICLGVLLYAAAPASARAEIIDRTAAVVGSVPILESEIDLEIRLEALFNETPAPRNSPELRRRALQRLIERRLIAADRRLAGFKLASDDDLERAYRELEQRRFRNRSLAEAIAEYGLSPADVRSFLREQINFVRYVDFRFRTGLSVSDSEIEDRYKARRPAAEGKPPVDVADRLRRALLDEKVDKMLDERVRLLRSQTRVVILDPIAKSAGQEAPQ